MNAPIREGAHHHAEVAIWQGPQGAGVIAVRVEVGGRDSRRGHGFDGRRDVRSSAAAANPGMADPQQKIIDACALHFATYKKDCSAFVRAVAQELGYTLTGNADSITADIDKRWIKLASGAEAAEAAARGKFVIAALASKDHVPPAKHGHVVVVIGGALYNGKYPMCWGGSLGDYCSKGDKSVGQVWGKRHRDKVIYRQAP